MASQSTTIRKVLLGARDVVLIGTILLGASWAGAQVQEEPVCCCADQADD